MIFFQFQIFRWNTTQDKTAENGNNKIENPTQWEFMSKHNIRNNTGTINEAVSGKWPPKHPP